MWCTVRVPNSKSCFNEKIIENFANINITINDFEISDSYAMKNCCKWLFINFCCFRKKMVVKEHRKQNLERVQEVYLRLQVMLKSHLLRPGRQPCRRHTKQASQIRVGLESGVTILARRSRIRQMHQHLHPPPQTPVGSNSNNDWEISNSSVQV